MNLRTVRWILVAYVLCDLLLGYAGFIPLTELAAAQFTTVTGTVVDPNGIPYANGTISATLVTSASPTLNGLAYTPPTQPAGLSLAGSFTLQLADNTVLLPANTKWNFTVCSAVGTVNPAIGTGSQCFTLAAPITISGASQSISTQLNAAALVLTVSLGGAAGVGPGTINTIPKFTAANVIGASSLTDNGTFVGTAEPVQVGSGTNLLPSLRNSSNSGWFFPSSHMIEYAATTSSGGTGTKVFALYPGVDSPLQGILASSGLYGWSSGSNPETGSDTDTNRAAAGIVCAGTGAASPDCTGGFKATTFQVTGGTTPTAGMTALGTTTVGALPAAAAGNVGQVIKVSDSTAVAAEGQTCVGSSTNTALAFSNGTVWKCF
jgi:hypothetical protein